MQVIPGQLKINLVIVQLQHTKHHTYQITYLLMFLRYLPGNHLIQFMSFFYPALMRSKMNLYIYRFIHQLQLYLSF